MKASVMPKYKCAALCTRTSIPPSFSEAVWTACLMEASEFASSSS